MTIISRPCNYVSQIYSDVSSACSRAYIVLAEDVDAIFFLAGRLARERDGTGLRGGVIADL